MPALLRGAEPQSTAGSSSDEDERREGRSRGAARGPRLVRLLAHGNQLEAGEDEEGQLHFPRQAGRGPPLASCKCLRKN